ncbi:Uncharacterised protein [Mycobacterium tuberculosis]|uniref:Uncharacterized protein n=1 Tax=Mycobacterium tuberculosis TaxID=1773 RepID=A0A654TNG9_MYCTX|nr:Uncharacterised protein [Mycobacterium tuberculosis]CFE52756.1 Uncharacterised protein [Mycobacterium tuberculosis]CKR63219.1 Uncharacterised protein [Mycobacterium tuberculosis]CNM26215.1 Uncharacterised protein [Mycobacterium tuberculosis]CNM62016.1 Uncharacterised protein [Mycobacterium tuberculosis]
MISLLMRSNGLVDQIFCQCALGNAVNANTSALASSISGPILGNDAARRSRTPSQVACTASASGAEKIIRNMLATMSALSLGTWASRLRAKCTRQR